MPSSLAQQQSSSADLAGEGNEVSCIRLVYFTSEETVDVNEMATALLSIFRD